jgi:hypothetical protein
VWIYATCVRLRELKRSGSRTGPGFDLL